MQQPAWANLPSAKRAAEQGDAGALLRLARTAAGLTLAEAGEALGYSASTLSRMETGRRRVTDIVLLRRLAETFCIPPGMLGLTPELGPGHTGRGSRAGHGEEDDPMRRRELLAGLVAVPLAGHAIPPTGTAAAGTSAEVDPGQFLLTALQDVLLHPRAAEAGPDGPPSLAQITRELQLCMTAFQASRYTVLASRLPGLVRQAEALTGTGPAVAATRAEVFNAMTRVFIKFEVPGLGWMAADRAMSAARASADPVVLASCTRNMVSLCRRDHHYADAQDLALDAVEQLSRTGLRPPAEHLSLTGMLLCNAAYAAAQAGDRDRSSELLDLASDAARRLGGDGNERWTAFGPTNVTLHRISAAHALGDAGTAIAAARTVNPADLRLPERRSRYWVDVARAYQSWGKHDLCYQALSIAERQAPEEVRARPVVRKLAHELLHSPATLPGLRDLASRVGAHA